MKKNILRLIIFILTFIIWWNFGLAADEKPDYWPTKGWRTASPGSQGVDSKLLVKMLDTIGEKKIAIHSVLVIRNGYIVLDAYSYPYDSDDTLNIHSCTKSVSSALVGIGIDKGYIKDVNQPVLDFFPMRVAKNLDDDSDGSESQQYRDSYQDETKKNGKNDQSCKDDDAQNSSSKDRPKGCSNLIRRKRYLFRENGNENDCQDKPNG